MSIEAECFRVRRWKDDTLVRSDTVHRGASETLPYLQRIQILATCDVDNSSGTIRLKTPIRRSRKLSVTLFESDDDLEGRKVSYSQPIKITGEQELAIFHRAEKKEIVIFLNKENRSEDKTPPIDADRLAPVA